MKILLVVVTLALGVSFGVCEESSVMKVQVDFCGDNSLQKNIKASFEILNPVSPKETNINNFTSFWLMSIPKHHSIQNPTLMNSVTFSSEVYSRPEVVNRLTVVFQGELRNTLSKIWWPSSGGVNIKGKVVSPPQGNGLIFVDQNANYLNDVGVVVFYDSSQRKESYTSNTIGYVNADKSSLQKAMGVEITFPSKIKIYIYGKNDWSKGLVIIEPESRREP